MLVEEVEELAAKQNTSIDQIVSLAIAAHVFCLAYAREHRVTRQPRKLEKVDEVLARVPDVPPQSGDEL